MTVVTTEPEWHTHKSKYLNAGPQTSQPFDLIHLEKLFLQNCKTNFYCGNSFKPFQLKKYNYREPKCEIQKS